MRISDWSSDVCSSDLRGGDDHFLLAIHHLEEAVLVELADVTGVDPAVGVDELASGVLLAVVAGHGHRAAGEDLAVLGELDLDARERAAHGAEAERVRTAGSDRRRGLGHPVDVIDAHAETGAEDRKSTRLNSSHECA